MTAKKHVLAIYAPGSRSTIRRLFESQRPWRAFADGEVLSLGRERLRIVEVTASDAGESHMTTILTEHVERAETNVITMPVGDASIVADFLRYHVLVRVFDGDPEAWLEELRHRSRDDISGGDIRFIRWIRARLRTDPMLLTAIRRMVDSTPLAMNKATP